VAEDIRQAAELVAEKKPLCLFNTISNKEGTVCETVSGDYQSEFARGCLSFKDRNSVKIKRKARLVIASAGGFPYDTNLIQSHKALYNAYQALAEGGTLALLAECPDGITGKGERADLKFLDYFNLTLEQMDAKFRQDFDSNCNTAYSIAEKAGKCNLILVSRLQSEPVRKMKLIPARTLPEALKSANELTGKTEPEAYLIEDVATILPVPA
jgi:nickel-dependent lactate racemase